MGMFQSGLIRYYNHTIIGVIILLNRFLLDFKIGIADTYEQEHGVSQASREACLDHHEKDVTKRAYTNMADYTSLMKILMQWWADFIDRL